MDNPADYIFFTIMAGGLALALWVMGIKAASALVQLMTHDPADLFSTARVFRGLVAACYAVVSFGVAYVISDGMSIMGILAAFLTFLLTYIHSEA